MTRLLRRRPNLCQLRPQKRHLRKFRWTAKPRWEKVLNLHRHHRHLLRQRPRQLVRSNRNAKTHHHHHRHHRRRHRRHSPRKLSILAKPGRVIVAHATYASPTRAHLSRISNSTAPVTLVKPATIITIITTIIRVATRQQRRGQPRLLPAAEPKLPYFRFARVSQAWSVEQRSFASPDGLETLRFSFWPRVVYSAKAITARLHFCIDVKGAHSLTAEKNTLFFELLFFFFLHITIIWVYQTCFEEYSV